MDLRHLKYFLAVAETRSFTQAAANCYVAQSALSQQIARLEKDVGATLFSRTSRSVRLTAAGELLEPLARRILADVDNARPPSTRWPGCAAGGCAWGWSRRSPASVDLVEVMADYRRPLSRDRLPCGQRDQHRDGRGGAVRRPRHRRRRARPAPSPGRARPPVLAATRSS
jgi:DNA-binding transcriptional LysR family regulator